MITKTQIKQASNSENFKQALQDVFISLKPYKGKAFKLTAFVDAKNFSDYIDKKNQLSEALKLYFETECPTWSMLSEAPENSTLCVELQCADVEKKYLDFNGLPIVILEEKELWVSGILSLDEDLQISSNAVFESLSAILKKYNFEYDDIVRQWNYIGEILKIKTKDGLNIQNYQLFNDIRNTYYRQHKKNADFPAATGIGMKTQGLVVDIFAKKTKLQIAGTNLRSLSKIEVRSLSGVEVQSVSSVQSLPLRSRIQKNPFAYSEAVLIGDEKNKKPPLFERARILHSTDQSQIFVSGTASIENQETVGIGDVSAQTENTIQYIKDLISLENIRHNYPQIILHKQNYLRVRVYVKHKHDMETVFKICTAHFPEHVINMVEADVCRDNLLVEIEADLHS
jgi:enamine deaminase RidA (YjgF/YER057c/UK114 family)